MRLQSADYVGAAKTPVLSVQPTRAAIVTIGRDDLRHLLAMGTRAVELPRRRVSFQPSLRIP